MVAKERRRIARAGWIAGAKYNFNIIDAALAAGIPVSLGYAIVQTETGFKNVFGHDPTTSIPDSWKGKRVTKRRYQHYKRNRPTHGMQGVGLTQLTWYAYQDAADKFGGCWRTKPNATVGFRVLAGLIGQYGEAAGIARYNGNGPAAERYSTLVRERQRAWHKVLTK